MNHTEHALLLRLLQLSDIVPGRYVFQLTVSDAQGLTASDTASVIVHPDPMLLDLVEITFTVDVSVLTQSEVDALRQKLILLLGDGTQLVVRNLHSNPKTGEAILIFYVQKVELHNLLALKSLISLNWPVSTEQQRCGHYDSRSRRRAIAARSILERSQHSRHVGLGRADVAMPKPVLPSRNVQSRDTGVHVRCILDAGHFLVLGHQPGELQ